MTAPVFLLSDFGTRDAFVGVMRAVVASHAPASPVHDLLHEIPPQDLVAARVQLAAAVPWLPPGSVVCAVIDPGVGGARRGVIVRARRTDGARITAVAPDNGLLSPLLRGDPAPYGTLAVAERAWVLSRGRLPPRGPGTTFDGRDLFAPAAARLARGDDPASLGEVVGLGELVAATAPEVHVEDGTAVGRVVWIDRFGNLVGDVRSELLAGPRWTAHVGGHAVSGPAAGYADVPIGAPVAYVGSLGTVEIGLRDGDAAAAWGIVAGCELRVVAD